MPKAKEGEKPAGEAAEPAQPTTQDPNTPSPSQMGVEEDPIAKMKKLPEGIEVGHRGVQEMPAFQLDPAQIDDLIAYLKWIGG